MTGTRQGGYAAWCDRFHATVQRRFAPRLVNSQFAYRNALARALDGGGRWLDLGCGHGFFPEWMPERETPSARGWRVAGVDLDVASIRRHARLNWKLQADGESLPFCERAFDLVSANMVVEHVAQPARLFGEVARILRPGGRFVVHTPNVFGYTTALARLLPKRTLRPLAQRLLDREPDDVYDTFYRANSKGALLRLAGAAHLATETFEHVHSSPQLIRIPPAMLLEFGAAAAMDWLNIERARVCIVAVFRKG